MNLCLGCWLSLLAGTHHFVVYDVFQSSGRIATSFPLIPLHHMGLLISIHCWFVLPIVSSLSWSWPLENHLVGLWSWNHLFRSGFVGFCTCFSQSRGHTEVHQHRLSLMVIGIDSLRSWKLDLSREHAGIEVDRCRKEENVSLLVLSCVHGFAVIRRLFLIGFLGCAFFGEVNLPFLQGHLGKLSVQYIWSQWNYWVCRFLPARGGSYMFLLVQK